MSHPQLPHGLLSRDDRRGHDMIDGDCEAALERHYRARPGEFHPSASRVDRKRHAHVGYSARRIVDSNPPARFQVPPADVRADDPCRADARKAAWGIFVMPGIVGREVELAAIQELLDRFAEAPSQLTLAGAARIGKTTVWVAAVGAATYRLQAVNLNGTRSRIGAAAVAR